MMCELKSIRYFDAIVAKKLAYEVNFGMELIDVIKSIFNAAKRGTNVLYVYNALHSETIKELQLRGFLIEFQIDKEFYCIIKW